MRRALAMRLSASLAVIVLLAPAFANEAFGQQMFGSLKADRILFLGNSITLHGPKADIGWKGNWGMAASAEAKDYVHLLSSAISLRARGQLILEATPIDDRKSTENVINIADIFERNYASYRAAKIEKQLAWGAAIVIVQCGENVPSKTFDAAAFTKALQALLNDLKEAGNPRIFVTSHILGSNPVMDDIKRKVCDEDSKHRTFVDITSKREKITANGFLGHPGDSGMRIIYDAILASILRKAGNPE